MKNLKIREWTDRVMEWGGVRRDIVFLVISAFGLVLSFFVPDILPFDPAWIAIVLCGLPVVVGAVIGLITEFDIKADVLVSIALIAAVVIGEDFAAGEVAVIMQLGALLEELTVARARAGIERLIELSPHTARVIDGEHESVIPAENVQVGDRIRVLPGESVPVDGTILTGQTSIDESVMTGEALPVDKAPGDTVRSGTVNQFGAFEMRAQRVGEDSSLQRMIALVESADAGKAEIVRLADRWATRIVVIALVSAGLTWFFTGEILRAVTILVVFCPCALVLATPTAIVAAIGNVTKYGILVREGDALERLSEVKRIAFDKTGTLTYGRLEVVDVVPGADMTKSGLFALAASVESLSEHPIGKAITRGWKTAASATGIRDSIEKTPETVLRSVTDFSMIPGRGVSGTVSGRTIVAGNREMMREWNVQADAELEAQATLRLAEGCTLTSVAVDGKAAGFIVLADTVRPSARDTVTDIKSLGITPVLATGDHTEAASTIARITGIDEVTAECLPEAKMRLVDTYEASGSPTCMVGDGINDAPALKRATVGIALGGVGSDIAVDAADIVLVKDDISALPHLLALSKRMMTTIKLNMTFSMVLNFAAILLAMIAVLNPVTGALVHNIGSVVVIVNSALLLRWRKR